MTMERFNPIQPSDIRAAVQFLGQAFRDDPAVMHIANGELSHRVQFAEWFCRLVIQLGLSYGNVYISSASAQGVAVWIAPGQSPLGLFRLVKAGLYKLPLECGLKASRRFFQLMNQVEAYHLNNMPDSHWHLMLLGVNPTYQRQGIGQSLVTPMLAKMDTDQIPGYLETFREGNVEFYQKLGFTVVTKKKLTSDLSFWAMCRRPLF